MTTQNPKKDEGEDGQSPSKVADAARILPTSVRASMGVDATELETSDRRVELAGRFWVVRIVGRSNGGRSLSDVGLVELEFAPLEGGGVPVRRLIVSESGRELSDLELEELLSRGPLPAG